MIKAIQVINLFKRFDDFIALNHINFTVNSGEIFGYLGPNGSGKTTTIRILTAISRATSGTVLIAGHDIQKEEYKAKEKSSLIPENPIVYPELSGLNNLVFTAGLYRIPRKERKQLAVSLLKEFNLYDRRNQSATYYSKGMKRRLSIAMGLISNPEILFLDEPTVGLDLSSQNLIREKIIEFSEKGITIFLTTHNLDEAAQLCDRVAILDKGKILTIDSPHRLKSAMVENRAFEFEIVPPADPESVLREYLKKTNQKNKFMLLRNSKIRVYSQNPSEWGQEFLNWTQHTNVPIATFQTVEANLKDVFLFLIDKGKLG